MQNKNHAMVVRVLFLFVYLFLIAISIIFIHHWLQELQMNRIHHTPIGDAVKVNGE